MKPASLITWLLVVAAPAGAWIALLPRAERRHGKLRVALGTALLGALAFAPAALVEGLLLRWAGLDKHARAVDLAALVYALLVAAPLEQGLKVAAVAPVARSRHMAEPIDGIVYSSAAALGFVTAHNAAFLWGRDLPSIDALRALMAVPAHLFLAAAWGHALGRERRRLLGGRRFNAAWLGATLFNGVYDHIVFARGPGALIAAAPILLCIGFVAFLAAQDLLRRGSGARASEPRARRFLRSIAPPSITTMREALRSSERPVMLSWIGLGALVTTGVMTANLVLAVALGHELGVDFAAVDRADAQASSAAPLVLIGAAALAAFPIAGFLVARASAARSVLEPAISAALAILGSLVLLGLAAPIAVVFALAFAPIAFGLACAGAWMGMTR
ncbi:MAG: PrsW family intramembrane metalloprotease [Polyangiaceae bacterium]|nr:PrsW family intramembrane metalloprotease [Polyangiaceae bacterium]